jgi:hypothetical protein
MKLYCYKKKVELIFTLRWVGVGVPSLFSPSPTLHFKRNNQSPVYLDMCLRIQWAFAEVQVVVESVFS